MNRVAARYINIMVFGIIALMMTLYIIRSKEGFAVKAEPSEAEPSTSEAVNTSKAESSTSRAVNPSEAEPSKAERSKLISEAGKAMEKARTSINNFKDAQKKMEDLISMNRDQAGLTKSQLFLDQIKSVNEGIDNVWQEFKRERREEDKAKLEAHQ